MISTIIICITCLIALFILLKWAKDMSSANLPMFTYGECVWKKKEDNAADNTEPIGFKLENPVEDQDKKKTDKEAKDAVFKDPVALTASLLRGEVDIDDITN